MRYATLRWIVARGCGTLATMSNSYELGRLPKIYAGAEAIASLPEIIASLGGRTAAIIADEAVVRFGYISKLRAALDGTAAGMATGTAAGTTAGEHIIPPGEPDCATVNAAAAFARGLDAPAIVGVGGGSALDVAKQAAALVASGGEIERYLLAAQPFAGSAPMIAIPTTAGTGSEVTRTCIVTDAHGRKVWTWDDALLPDAVILDATATVSMPPAITVATGLDAFVHALEAATGQRRNAIAAASSLQALRLVRAHLRRAVDVPDDLGARHAMQEAALLAGIAIDNCGTGIGHCIGHALGSLYHVPHGVAVALAIEATFAWNAEDGGDAWDGIADALGVRIWAMADEFSTFLRDLGFGDIVRALPGARFDTEAIAAAMAFDENLPMLRNNARVPDDAARHELARRTVAAWEAHRALLAS